MVEKIKIGDREVDVEPIDVHQASERWNEYLLDDGSVLKVKLVLKKVFRVPDQYDGEGCPVYVFQSQNVTTTHSPENLRRKK